MAPIVHGLEAQYDGQIKFSFLDVDDPATDPFKQQFGFTYQPMFVLLDANGTPIKTWFGAVSAEEFATEFAKVIQ
jgi:thioredoxin-like negative regulator of GroEL